MNNIIILDHTPKIKDFNSINKALAEKADVIFRSIRRKANRKNKINIILNETNR